MTISKVGKFIVHGVDTPPPGRQSIHTWAQVRINKKIEDERASGDSIDRSKRVKSSPYIDDITNNKKNIKGE
jgi:hypothetical protein